MPRPKASCLYSFDSRVSADGDVSGWDILFLSLLFAFVLATNGDGTSGAFGVGGEGRRASWIGRSPARCFNRESRLCERAPVDHDR